MAMKTLRRRRGKVAVKIEKNSTETDRVLSKISMSAARVLTVRTGEVTRGTSGEMDPKTAWGSSSTSG